MKIIDFRSDTITKPSPEMWDVLRNLNNESIGDDVYKEDPKVNELEQKAAKKTGKEAALFVATGTMGNLISTLSHTRPGEEIMVEEMSHMAIEETGGPARISQVITKMFPSSKGIPDFEYLQSKVFDGTDIHEARTSLIALENTHNYHGGVVIPSEIFKQARDFSKKNNMKFHVDGARIFNASVARNLNVKEFTKHADSIMFCLSKGLSCPIGSIIAGSSDFIDKTRRYRKMVGGGWRQAGIMASMGLIALEDKWIQRLKEDHDNARKLSEAFLDHSSKFDVIIPETNILVVQAREEFDDESFLRNLEERGILGLKIYRKTLRFVTHYGLNEEDIERANEIIQEVL